MRPFTIAITVLLVLLSTLSCEKKQPDKQPARAGNMEKIAAKPPAETVDQQPQPVQPAPAIGMDLITTLGTFEYPSAMPFSMCADKKGNILVLSQCKILGQTNAYKAILIKLSADGTTLIEKDLEVQPLCEVHVDSSNSIYVFGENLGHAAMRPFSLIKFTENAEVVWKKSFVAHDASFTISPDDALFVFYRPYTAERQYRDAKLMRLSSDGTVLVDQRVDGLFDCRRVVADATGNVFTAGNAPVVRLSNRGEILQQYLTKTWEYGTYPGGSMTVHEIDANDILLTPDSFIVAGTLPIPEESSGAALVKRVRFSGSEDFSTILGSYEQYLSIVTAQSGLIYCLAYSQDGSAIAVLSAEGKLIGVAPTSQIASATYHELLMDADSDFIIAGVDGSVLRVDKVRIDLNSP